MTGFQWATIPVLLLLAAVDGPRVLFGHPSFRRDRLLRFVVWLAAAATIYNPDLTSWVANWLGISRGTDLVLYVFVMAFLAVTFHFYAQGVKLQRQLTLVVRHVAISEAKRGGPPATDRPQ
jgi:small membrane protein